MIEDVIRRFLASHGLERARIVVAVSGGTDSTVLLLAIHAIGGCELIAAHVNHHLRGDESDGDEAFVRAQCHRLGIPLRILDGALEPDSVRSGGIESAARRVRYQRLLETRECERAACVATAHHRNDQAETVLMRLMDGAAANGLRGIHPVRADGVVRPMLDAGRPEIDEYLKRSGIVPRFDSSNADERFRRNALRKTISSLGDESIAAIAGIAERAGVAHARIAQVLDSQALVEETATSTLFVRLPQTPSLTQALLHRHIRRLEPGARDVSRLDLQRLAAQLSAVKRISVSRTLELVRGPRGAVLRHRPLPVPPFEQTLGPGETIALPGGARFQLAHICSHAVSETDPFAGVDPRPGQPARQRFVLPHGSDPLFLVRNRRPGDRLQPLGFQHVRKLKHLLIDRKIPRENRDSVPLLLWRDEIVWVAGVEVSERFRIGHSDGALYEAWNHAPGSAG